MFKEVVTIKEYHKNGTLFFKEKRAESFIKKQELEIK